MHVKTDEQVQADGARLRGKVLAACLDSYLQEVVTEQLLVHIDRYARWCKEAGAVEALERVQAKAISTHGWAIIAVDVEKAAATARRDAIAQEVPQRTG